MIATTATTPNYAEWLTLSQVASSCGVSSARVRSWCVSGVRVGHNGRVWLRGVKLGGTWKVSPDALAVFVDLVTRSAVRVVERASAETASREREELDACLSRLARRGVGVGATVGKPPRK